MFGNHRTLEVLSLCNLQFPKSILLKAHPTVAHVALCDFVSVVHLGNLRLHF